jgi:short subunit dehydrogenase-like uncharacterized protein
MNSVQQSGPIAVYGATGFTGKLVARELHRRGADFVVAGRNQAKLDALAGELGGIPARAASLEDPAALRTLLDPCAAVIACAGPFAEHGEPVLAAAVDTGTHYIDTTGEQPFMQMVFDSYGGRAAGSGAALVTGMGFDYAPGDLLASLVADGMGPLDEIVLAYSVAGFGATRGTALSALGIIGGDSVIWSDGRRQKAPRNVDGGDWEFPAPVGRKRTLRYPSGEQLTVPMHVQTDSVRTLLNGMMVPARLAPISGYAMPALGMALRTPLRRAAEAFIGRMPEGPSDEDRKGARFMVSCEARAGARTRRGVTTGADVYGLTAVTTSHAALLAAAPDFDRSGALAPAQAFDAAEFFAALEDFGVNVNVEPAPEPAATAR